MGSGVLPLRQLARSQDAEHDSKHEQGQRCCGIRPSRPTGVTHFNRLDVV